MPNCFASEEAIWYTFSGLLSKTLVDRLKPNKPEVYKYTLCVCLWKKCKCESILIGKPSLFQGYFHHLVLKRSFGDTLQVPWESQPKETKTRCFFKGVKIWKGLSLSLEWWPPPSILAAASFSWGFYVYLLLWVSNFQLAQTLPFFMPSGSFFLADAVKFSPVDIFHEKNGRGSVFPSLPLKPTNCNWKAKISQQGLYCKARKVGHFKNSNRI